MKSVWKWLVTHRAVISVVPAVVAAGLTATGHAQAGALVGMLATWLHGAGAAESDASKREGA